MCFLSMIWSCCDHFVRLLLRLMQHLRVTTLLLLLLLFFFFLLLLLLNVPLLLLILPNTAVLFIAMKLLNSSSMCGCWPPTLLHSCSSRCLAYSSCDGGMLVLVLLAVCTCLAGGLLYPLLGLLLAVEPPGCDLTIFILITVTIT